MKDLIVSNISDQERELRKNLRIKLEMIADRNETFDKYGNSIKTIHVTDVMRLLLDSEEVTELQKEFQKLKTAESK